MYPRMAVSANQQEAQTLSQRKLKLQQLEDEFFKLVTVGEVAQHLGLPDETVDFLYQYWKLKRKANFNRPLITPRNDEEDDLAKREQDVLLRRLKLFTHLRQDLERVRNLTYMVTRREKIKRSVCRVQEQIFHHYVRLLEEQHLPRVPSSVCLEDALFFNWVSTLVSKPKQVDQDLQRRERRKGSGCSDRRKPSDTAVDSRTHPSSKPEGRKAQRNEGQMLNTAKLAEHREAGPGADEGPECPKRRGGTRSEERRSGLRERAPPKAKPRLPKAAEEPVNKQVEKRAVGGPGALSFPGGGAAPNPRLSLDAVPKCNGSLRRVAGSQSSSRYPPSTAAAHGKNWGNFRIPKKSERLLQARPLEPVQTRRTDGTLPVTQGHAHTRAGRTENDSHVLDTQLTCSEKDVKEKKCQAEHPRGPAPITRRYGADFIRRGILAS